MTPLSQKKKIIISKRKGVGAWAPVNFVWCLFNFSGKLCRDQKMLYFCKSVISMSL
jgi:hypothetical protein